MLRSFPHMVGASPDDLSPEQEVAIEMHQLLDDGAKQCGQCKALVPDGRFCGACGEKIATRRRDAVRCPTPDCNTMSSTRFCPGCGERLISETAEQLDAGLITEAELVEQALATLASRRNRSAAGG